MIKKCKPEYKRRSFEGLATLDKEARRIALPLLGPHAFVSLDILAHWESIVGRDLAQGVFPEKLVFERDKRTEGTLLVKSAGGAFAMLFEHQKDRVIERINTFFGYPAVNRIKIQQGNLRLHHKSAPAPRELTPAEKEMLAHRVSSIQDGTLREQAYDLGKEILLKSS